MKAAAIERKNWVDRTVTPLPGWLVIFSWDHTKAGNHIGLVESAEAGADHLVTLEYNTSTVREVQSPDTHAVALERNGGVIARKTRSLKNDTVLGYVKLYDA